MADRPLHVLFLCTGNSARSILAESILRRLGAGRFRASSAGSQPTGRVHPMAIELLRERGHATDGLRSKSWEELAGADADEIDVVVTVCDRAAGEACPIWPGHPTTVHWGIDDPAAFTGSEAERRAAFARAFATLATRIEALTRLPVESMDPPTLQRRLEALSRRAPGIDDRAAEEPKS